MSAPDRDYYVTVCSVCKTASCWHGEHTRQEALDADIETSTASALHALNSEHPRHYSREKLRDVYGHDANEGCNERERRSRCLK